MKKNIKDTVEIVKMENPFEIEREEYTKDSVSKMMGKINNEIREYEYLYGHTPQIIFISRELEILLRTQMELMIYRQSFMINNRVFEISSIFGVNCMVTPVLQGLEFEVR